MSPWPPGDLVLPRVGWKNLTETDGTPEFALHYEPGCKPKIWRITPGTSRPAISL